MPAFGLFLYYLRMLCFQVCISEVRLLNFFGLSLLRGLGYWVVAGFVIEEIGKLGRCSHHAGVRSLTFLSLPIFACFAFQLSIFSEVRLLNFFGLSLLRGLGHWVVAGFVIAEIGKLGRCSHHAGVRSLPLFSLPIFACFPFQVSILSEVRLLNFFGLSFLRGLGHWVVAGFVIEEIGKLGRCSHHAGVRSLPLLSLPIFARFAFQLSILSEVRLLNFFGLSL